MSGREERPADAGSARHGLTELIAERRAKALRLKKADADAFPYAFPGPGAYRLFVQIKRHDRIETAAFDAQVGE